MTTQQSPLNAEEGVDLRKIIETLLRRWWLIAATLAVSTIISVGFSFLIQASVYESSGSAVLSVNGLDTGLRLTAAGYLVSSKESNSR